MSVDKVSEMISESSKHDQDCVQASIKSENSSSGQRSQVQQKRSSVVNSRKRHRPSTSESEKDSGFSDTSSEYLSTVEQMDCEDPGSLNLTCGRQAALSHTHKSAALRNPFTGLAPVYIMIKEPLSIPTSHQLLQAQLQAWGSARPNLGTAPGHNRVLVLQQPATATFRHLRAEEKDTYLPILNSYPKIAPHPDRQTDLPSPLSQDSLSSSSSLPLCSLFPCGTSRSSSLRAFSGSGSGSGSGGKKQRSSNLVKHRRFHNTLDILDKSRLLGITLRTKELIRQNSHTQREISELKEHTRLLCRAVQSNDPQAWDRLHQTMRCSGSYRDLNSRSDSPCPLFGPPAATHSSPS